MSDYLSESAGRWKLLGDKTAMSLMDATEYAIGMRLSVITYALIGMT